MPFNYFVIQKQMSNFYLCAISKTSFKHVTRYLLLVLNAINASTQRQFKIFISKFYFVFNKLRTDNKIEFLVRLCLVIVNNFYLNMFIL